ITSASITIPKHRPSGNDPSATLPPISDDKTKVGAATRASPVPASRIAENARIRRISGGDCNPGVSNSFLPMSGRLPAQAAVLVMKALTATYENSQFCVYGPCVGLHQ